MTRILVLVPVLVPLLGAIAVIVRRSDLPPRSLALGLGGLAIALLSGVAGLIGEWAVFVGADGSVDLAVRVETLRIARDLLLCVAWPMIAAAVLIRGRSVRPEGAR